MANLAKTNPVNFLPLTPVVFHILMALAQEPRHGYGIIKEVKESTKGDVTLHTGTLYQAIRRLLETGMIREVETKVDPKLDDERRRYYALSGLGRKVLVEEVRRLEGMVRLAHARKVPDWKAG